MTSSPKVSVIVPNYNHARFLRERLDSIYNQTFQDFEVILLDDASTDNSVEILREYAARPRTRLVLNEKNSGSTFAQWNKGVALATGEYIWIAESDDFAALCFMERLSAFLDVHSDVGLVQCDSRLIDEFGSAKPLTLHDRRATKYGLPFYESDDVVNGKIAIASWLGKRNRISNASAVLFRKHIYTQAGGADEYYCLAGDWLMWIKILQDSNMGCVSDVLNSFRHHSDCVRNRTTMTATEIRELSLILRYLIAHKLVTIADASRISGRLANNLIKVLWVTLGRGLSPCFLRGQSKGISV